MKYFTLDDMPPSPEKKRLLASVPLFAALEERALDALLAATTTRRLAPREALFHKGDPGEQLYVVMSGRLKAKAEAADGKEVIFALMGPQEVIGEIALLDSEPRSATVEAIEASELLALHRRDFLPVLERHPKVAIRLAGILAGRLRRLSDVTEDTAFLTLPSRLAKKLLSLAESDGIATPEGTRIRLRLPQSELGELVCTSRESVNKLLRAWVQEGVVGVDHGFITLRKRRPLEALADLWMV
ncbi:MAG TPA: Crp/Fnr family transcriptional regulator [Myxococcota bacterium]|nr:Crp/Fnr family transcriptional regulator [Myxococcota bacterium]